MHPTELHMRQQADTAREAIKSERRKESMKDARREINIYLAQGMDRNVAINFVLDTDNKISIVDKKEVRKYFRYGCHTIYSMAEELSVLNSQNNLDLVVETI